MKHILAVFIIIFLLCLGYGMWLYSESLRTGVEFEVLLKKDFSAKQEAIKGWNNNRGQ